ncbi:MAG: ABC transporter ATP-binding protein, partial [Nocardiopsaceae bacterium]|nr:ABC transporter ATP-binding protein [Nocardiopsaceae bacterium]
LGAPEHPYTRSLHRAAPSLAAAPRRPPRPAPPFPPESPPPPALAPVPPLAPAEGAGAAVLRAEGLVKDFAVPGLSGGKTRFRAVDRVSLSVGPGETLGLVGESGSGKTTVARMLLRLTPPTGGRILLDGQDVTAARGPALRGLRQQVQYVFQNPYTSLNPRMSIGDIVADPLRSFGIGSRVQRRESAAPWLDRVGLPASAAERRPAELSGGQRQRVAIARALILGPRVVVLDEPVSALDVLVQAQILTLLASLQRESGVSYLFISHDLAVVRRVAQRVAVMARGRLVEEGPVERVLDRPRHDYTRQLVDAIPGSSRRHLSSS